jgi:hypothetical protein
MGSPVSGHVSAATSVVVVDVVVVEVVVDLGRKVVLVVVVGAG